MDIIQWKILFHLKNMLKINFYAIFCRQFEKRTQFGKTPKPNPLDTIGGRVKFQTSLDTFLAIFF